MISIPLPRASRTSWSKPSQFGSEKAGFSGSIALQLSGSRTLSTPASRISSKSGAGAGLCGEIPMKPGGR